MEDLGRRDFEVAEPLRGRPVGPDTMNVCALLLEEAGDFVEPARRGGVVPARWRQPGRIGARVQRGGCRIPAHGRSVTRRQGRAHDLFESFAPRRAGPGARAPPKIRADGEPNEPRSAASLRL
jgi:hypothetical protein